MAYKVQLTKAKPKEMNFLSTYAFKMDARLLIDLPDFVGIQKNIRDPGGNIASNMEIRFPVDAQPPLGVEAYNNSLAVATEDSLPSKIAGIAALYKWAKNLEQDSYIQCLILNLPLNSPPEEQSEQAVLVKIVEP